MTNSKPAGEQARGDEPARTPSASGPALDSSGMAAAIEANSAEWLRVTLSSIGDGVITTDRDGRVTFLNPVAQNLTGWSQEHALGVPLTEVFRIVNEDTRAEVENPALRALRDGVIVGLANHTHLIARDGSERPIDDSAAPIRNKVGETAGAVLVFRDITERREAEMTLRDSEMRYRRLFQTAKDGILILDAVTGKIIDANAFMSALVGLDPGELLGKELYEIGMFKDIDENKSAFRELQRTGYLRHEHLPVRNRRGERVEVEFIANIYHEDHRLVAQCNVRDISQRVALEQQIKQQATELAEQSRRKDEFLAMLSHELRNPLAPIRAAVHLLKLHDQGSASALQRQARDIIERQVASLTALVGDLLEVSRVVSGRIRLNLHTIDLNQIVRHAVETVRPLIDQHRHTLTLDLQGVESPSFGAGTGVWVNADATRIEEVVVNLLNNAAKYTPEGGAIHVRCEISRPNDTAVLRVRDTGVGIDANLLPRIFDLFSQAERSLDRSAGGLGIGLSLAQRLVELHGGTLQAFSPPRPSGRRSGTDGTLTDPQPGGSEFIVTIPLAPPPAAPAAAAEQLAPADRPPVAHEAKPEGVRVLIVDDNIDLVSMLAGVLTHKGYSVNHAHTGPSGHDLIRCWNPEVVLLDIGLPGLDGYEIARRVRADPLTSAIRLIALTGYGREPDIAIAREAGFDGHLVKPVDFDRLQALMDAPIAGPNSGPT